MISKYYVTIVVKSLNLVLNVLPISPDKILDIKERWTYLESKANNASYFLTWDWIGQWLKQTSKKNCPLFLVEAYLESKVIAIGILCSSKNNQSYFLNKTSIQSYDQIWIEYNDFLMDLSSLKVDANTLRNLLINKLLNHDNFSCRAITIDMCKIQNFTNNNYFSYEKIVSPGYRMSLHDCDTKEKLLSKLSKNSKRQIQKSISLLQQASTLSISVLDKVEDKVSAFEKLASQHIIQWQKTEWGSGFSNPFFVEFHRNLIQESSNKILVLNHGDKTLAYGYFFCFNNDVYFYLSSIHKHTDNRIKIGLVFHTLAMVHFKKEGYEEYDFLAGDARYKKSLSDQSYELKSYRFVKRDFLGYLENIARKIKEYLVSN